MEVLLRGDKEDLQLEADVGRETPRGRDVVVQLVQQTAAVLAHGVVGMKEQGLLVQGLGVVADKDFGDVDEAADKKDGGEGVRGEVPASSLVRALPPK